MDTKLESKILTMAAAALGLSLVGGCSKQAQEPAAAESGETAAGGESSCGAGSCGAAHDHQQGAAESAPAGAAAEGEGPATPTVDE